MKHLAVGLHARQERPRRRPRGVAKFAAHDGKPCGEEERGQQGEDGGQQLSHAGQVERAGSAVAVVIRVRRRPAGRVRLPALPAQLSSDTRSSSAPTCKERALRPGALR